ncbi:MAG TPA: helix-turn-helix domain-containing protein [Terriglobales bacterium]|nr:helix-turn-helix domain-containing protein [Terriglobales bacterium]
MPRAAEILKVGRRTVCRLIEEGEIEGHQLRINRGHWRVSLPSLLAYLEKIKERYGSSPIHSKRNAAKPDQIGAPFLGTSEAAKLLDVTECTVIWLIRRGKFKAFQNGRSCKWKIDRESFEVWRKTRAARETIEKPDLWITTTQAAEMLKVSVSSLRGYIRDGLLVSNQHKNRTWRWVLRGSVEALIQSWMEQAQARRGLQKQQ